MTGFLESRASINFNMATGKQISERNILIVDYRTTRCSLSCCPLTFDSEPPLMTRLKIKMSCSSARVNSLPSSGPQVETPLQWVQQEKGSQTVQVLVVSFEFAFPAST